MTASRPPAPTTTRRRRLGAIAALGAVVAFVLTGCVKIDMGFTLHTDNTADGTVIFALQDSAAKALGQDPQELFDESLDGEDPADEFGEGATSEPYHQDGYTGTKITLNNAPLSALSGDSTSSGDPDDLNVTREGDEFVISGKLDLTELGEDAAADDSGLSSDMLKNMFDVRISFTFPGKVVSADKSAKIDGNTVTWTSDAGDVLNLDARGKAVGGGSSSGGVPAWIWFVVGAVVLLVVVGLVLFLVLRKKPAPADAAALAQQGYPQQGYPQGLPPQGYGQQGYGQQGSAPQGYPQPAPAPQAQPQPQPQPQVYPTQQLPLQPGFDAAPPAQPGFDAAPPVQPTQPAQPTQPTQPWTPPADPAPQQPQNPAGPQDPQV